MLFKAKLGAANSAMTTGGKELRLYEVELVAIVSSINVDEEIEE